MANVVFVDTSVLLNLLDVPRRNTDRDAVSREFKRRRAQGQQLVLPISTVIETGNHIAHIAEGGARRECADRFVRMLQMIVDSTAPFILHAVDWNAAFLSALIEGGTTTVSFIDHLTTGTIGCGDLSILVERDQYLLRVSKRTSAVIWTLDAGLSAYS